MADAAAAIHGAIGRMRSACVTGTNGKTTTVSMIESIVAAAGEPSARVTTIGSWVAGEMVTSDVSLDAFAATVERSVAAGVRTIAVETTSKALEAGFSWRWPAAVAVFTNLTRDHLDRHGTPERYLAAKAQLFMSLRPGATAVLNAADPASALLAQVIPPAVHGIAYAARPPDPSCAALPLALAADRVWVERTGTPVALLPSPLAERLGYALRLGVLGEVNADNALAAAVACDALGYAADAIRHGLEGFAGVPGRFEVVCREPLVVVDYAHTPDALERTLRSARALAACGGRSGRVVCVFGCGGDRDRGKRPMMGSVAAAFADRIVLTSDNPRNEDPARIGDDVEAGASGGPAAWRRELDRGRAVETAVMEAGPDDVVVIAGKGHERTQTSGGRDVPFSDVDAARAACEERTASGRQVDDADRP